MSEQYTPTWDRVREHYYLGRQQFDDPLFPAGGVTEIVAEFDRWYQAEIAAAEQRGAERERKDIAASLIDWDVMYGHEPGDEETRIQNDIANWIHSRADRLEADGD